MFIAVLDVVIVFFSSYNVHADGRFLGRKLNKTLIFVEDHVSHSIVMHTSAASILEIWQQIPLRT